MKSEERLYYRDLMAEIPDGRGVIARSDYSLANARLWWCRKPGSPRGSFKESYSDAVEYVFGGRS